MRDIVRIGGKLALICAVSAFLLGVVNMITEPKIAEYKAARLKAALEEVSPGGTIGEYSEVADNPGITGVYLVEKDGELSGCILNLKGAGYGGDLIILASYFPDGTLHAAVLMDNDETPGLGKAAEKAGYMDKYTGKAGKAIPAVKNALSAADADSVSGSTITFSGIGKVLVKGSEYAASLGGEK